MYSNSPGPKVHSASNIIKSPDISDPASVWGEEGEGGGEGVGVDIDRCISNSLRQAAMIGSSNDDFISTAALHDL